DSKLEKKPVPPAMASPSWIWLDKKPKDDQTIYFRKQFDVAHPIAAVTLQAACDDVLTLFIDGKKVVEHGKWQVPAIGDVTEHFVTAKSKTGQGKHVVAVKARNNRGTAGLLVRLIFEGYDRKTFTVVSDDSWQ